jgi:hypothetical protein
MSLSSLTVSSSTARSARSQPFIIFAAPASRPSRSIRWPSSSTVNRWCSTVAAARAWIGLNFSSSAAKTDDSPLGPARRFSRSCCETSSFWIYEDE